jgi:hydrogenase nickel incorporation protein HypB
VVDALVLNKLDLMPYLDFDRDAFRTAVRALNARAPIYEVSCKTGEGLPAWAEWLALSAAALRQGTEATDDRR